jgi:hypothetical protein
METLSRVLATYAHRYRKDVFLPDRRERKQHVILCKPPAAALILPLDVIAL